MSSLKDRLKRLTGGGAGAGSGGPGAGAPEEEREDRGNRPGLSGSAASGASAEQTKQADSLKPGEYDVEPLDNGWGKLDAALVRNGHGSFIRRRKVYPWNHVHGDIPLQELHACAEQLSAFHDGKPVAGDQLLFFDTETTGLGLGAGNVPFMVGLGFREETGFAVEQLFIRNPAEELAMLAYLKPIMEKYPYLVSYNGKSFDWPLLKSRFVMNRMKEGIAEPLHFDFLYPSRSLWRNTLPSCRLSKVEEARLGFHRTDDVPGSMAPALYFLYLAERRPSDIGPVFIHNELDILSLAGLAVLFARTLEGGAEPASLCPEEQYRLGLWLHRMGKEALSRQVLDLLHDSASGGSGVPGDVVPLLVPLAAHYKQLGAWDQAVSLWQRGIEAAKSPAIRKDPPLEAYIELSMYYEHRVKDYSTALLYAEEALSWAEERTAAVESLRRRHGSRKQGLKLQAGGDAADLPATAPADGGKRNGTASAVIGELHKRVGRLRTKQMRSARPEVRPDPGPSSANTAHKANRKRKPPNAEPEALTLF